MITRRDFLKIGAVSSLFLALPVNRLLKAVAVEAEFNGRIYRGAPNGEIHVSEDQRNTWNKHIRLAPESVVSNFFPDVSGSLLAEVDYQGHPFYLTLSPDGNKWLAS
jgi:hypothetical protein